jgi:transcriptional regulator with XRE-family HTH domain
VKGNNTTRKGRPAGLLLNPVAVNHLLGDDRPQAELARLAGVTAPVLSELMAGQRGATRPVADRIADALDCPAAVIFPELIGFTVAVRYFTTSGAES